jgi:peptidoglycan/xylan/chitin deacetylase (PgdA/CDA1 family)
MLIVDHDGDKTFTRGGQRPRPGVTSGRMSFLGEQRGRQEPARGRRWRVWGERLIALGSLIAVAAVVAVIVKSSIHGSGSHHSAAATPNSTTPAGHGGSGGSASSGAGKPGTSSVPILVYHVINAQPANSSANPALYVPAAQFSSQMAALKAAGWHAVTLDQVEAYWTHGVPLGTGKPIVLSFDNGYASQFTNALPVLKGLGWVGVENLQLTGLPPSEGGLTDSQIRGLVGAGWELDTQGLSHANLTTLDATQLSNEVTTARQMLHSRYGVPVNWFSYPSGAYTSTVTAAVSAAGYVGATTVNPGWASPQQDRFRLPRLVVVAGTSPSALLAQITAAQANKPVPSSSSGPGLA